MILPGKYAVCLANTLQLMKVTDIVGHENICQYKSSGKTITVAHHASQLYIIEDREDFLRKGGTSEKGEKPMYEFDV